jgi:hypothetical protein
VTEATELETEATELDAEATLSDSEATLDEAEDSGSGGELYHVSQGLIDGEIRENVPRRTSWWNWSRRSAWSWWWSRGAIACQSESKQLRDWMKIYGTYPEAAGGAGRDGAGTGTGIAGGAVSVLPAGGEEFWAGTLVVRGAEHSEIVMDVFSVTVTVAWAGPDGITARFSRATTAATSIPRPRRC